MCSSSTSFLKKSLFGSIVAVSLAACGGGEGDDDSLAPPRSDAGAINMPTGSYLPLKIGA